MEVKCQSNIEFIPLSRHRNEILDVSENGTLLIEVDIEYQICIAFESKQRGDEFSTSK